MRSRFFDSFNHMTMILGPSDPTAAVRIGCACKIEVLRGLEGTVYSLGVHDGQPRVLLKFDQTQKDALLDAWFRRYRSTPVAMFLPLGGGGVALRTLFEMGDIEIFRMSDAKFQDLEQLTTHLVYEFHSAMGRYNVGDDERRAA